MRYHVECLSWPIDAEVTWLDDGCDVGIWGGSRAHIGEVAMTCADGSIRTLSRGDGLDLTDARRFASLLSAAWQVPVCVRSGVCVPYATEEERRLMHQAVEQLLLEILNNETPGRGDL